VYECEHKCLPKKCPNYPICLGIWQENEYKYYGGRCYECEITFGLHLEFTSDEEECPVCLEIKDSHCKFTGCKHKCCVECFKKLCKYDEEEMNEYVKCVICRSEPLEKEWLRG